MNKILLALALLSISAIAQARSTTPSVLSITVRPLHSLGDDRSVTQNLTVDEAGRVVVRNSGRGGNRGRVVTQLSATEVARLNGLLSQAVSGKFENPNELGFNCLAIPTHETIIDGRNGTIPLFNGTGPCGSARYNTSQAGEALVEYAQDLIQRYIHN